MRAELHGQMDVTRWPDAGFSAPLALSARVDALRDLFVHIGHEHMRDVPILNTALCVEAVGFTPFRVLPDPSAPAIAVTDGERLPDRAIGVLVTPWLMNLVLLPLQREDDSSRLGVPERRRVGQERFDFIGAWEPSFGSFEACSLFSPVFEFSDQLAARTTALAVLASLGLTAAIGHASAVSLAAPQETVVSTRRAFFTGMRAGRRT